MALTINSVRQEVYRYLNEASNSTLGQLPSGTGSGTETISSDASVRTYILDGIGNLCRTCVVYPVTASYDIANATSKVSLMATPTTVSPAGTKLWFPRDVYIGSTRLIHASEQSIRANDQAYAITAATSTSAIDYWFRQDNYVLNVYPYNNTGVSVSVTIYGCGIPPTPTLDSDNIAEFLPDDLLRQLLASYAATVLVMKNVDDPSVAERMFWKQSYDEMRMKLWMQLDKSMKAPGGPYSVPPVAQPVTR